MPGLFVGIVAGIAVTWTYYMVTGKKRHAPHKYGNRRNEK
jgi:hypothetical protein